MFPLTASNWSSTVAVLVAHVQRQYRQPSIRLSMSSTEQCYSPRLLGYWWLGSKYFFDIDQMSLCGPDWQVVIDNFIYWDILGVDILGVDILRVDILRVDILGVDILRVDILRGTQNLNRVELRCFPLLLKYYFKKAYKPPFLVRFVVCLILHICPEFLGCMVVQ